MTLKLTPFHNIQSHTFLVFFFVVVSTVSVRGQEIWSFNKLKNYAFNYHPLISKSEIDLEISEETVKQSKLLRLPDLSANGINTFNNGRSLDALTYQYTQSNNINSIYRLQSNLNLYQGNRTRQLIKKNNLFAVNQKTVISIEKIKVLENLLISYLEACMVTEHIHVCSKKLTHLKTIKEYTISLINAGKLTNTTLALVDIENNLTIQELNLLNHKKESLLLNIQTQTNIPSHKIAVELVKLVFTDTTVYSNNQIKDIVKNHPGYQQKKANIAIQNKEIKLTKAATLPSINLFSSIGTGYSSLISSNTNESDWNSQFKNNYFKTVGLYVQVPLFNRLQNSYEISKNKLYATSLENTLELENLELSNKVQNTLNQVKVYHKNYKLAEKAIHDYNTVINEAQATYKSGRLGLFEYMNILKLQ